MNEPGQCATGPVSVTRPRLGRTDKQVSLVVGVAGDEVRGNRIEDDHLAAGRDEVAMRLAIAGPAARRFADQPGGAERQVADEYIQAPFVSLPVRLVAQDSNAT